LLNGKIRLHLYLHVQIFEIQDATSKYLIMR